MRACFSLFCYSDNADEEAGWKSSSGELFDEWMWPTQMTQFSPEAEAAADWWPAGDKQASGGNMEQGSIHRYNKAHYSPGIDWFQAEMGL